MSFRLEDGLLSAATFLEAENIPYCVVGGIAAIFWGTDRNTFDIDLAVSISANEQESFINKLLSKFDSKAEGNPHDFARKHNYLPVHTKDRIIIDFMFATLPFEKEAIQRAKKKRIRSRQIPIATVEDLILYKIGSQRPTDAMDVQKLIRMWHSKLDRKYLDRRVAELAAKASDAEVLNFYRDCLRSVRK